MEIKLGGARGGVALVSPEDYDEISKYSWRQDKDGYAIGNVNGKTVKMSRFIMKPEKNQIVDHIYGNILDNRREKLKNTTTQKNNENRRISKTKKSSKYRGVFGKKDKDKIRYRAIVSHDSQRISLGMFSNEVEAAEKFDMYIIHNNLTHIQLNFPDKENEYKNKEYKPIIKTKSSNYIGVTKTSSNKYASFIRNNYKRIHLGTFENEIDAAKKYDEYIIKNNIKSKKLNFPNEHPNYKPNDIIKTLCETINDTIVKLIVNCDRGGVIKIDREDYDKIKFYSCYVNKAGYARITINDNDLSLHRYIMNTDDPDIKIDHKDHDKLNNTKDNLRLSNDEKNAQNKKKYMKATSKYIGICYDKRNNKWIATIMKNGKTIFYKSYKEEEYTMRARDLYIMEFLKEDHYQLNCDWTASEIIEWKEIFKNYNLKSNKNVILRHKKCRGKSKYLGVYKQKNGYGWTSYIVKDKKNIFTKSNNNEEYVAKARDLYIINNLKNDNYILNFQWSLKEICKWNMILNNKIDKNIDIKILEEIISDDNKEYNSLIQNLDEIDKQYHQLIQ
ncbi:HNH endonuclease [Klosneuvirus KNV1]|uniref:HNH endonuclease n=1 Tax=Klosneuvirus KNV1 TaxID=1977640 RepID=A0A1V0SM19_9VIRU|nr:HNH endonuclease [Klosneuvirus KNV1]